MEVGWGTGNAERGEEGEKGWGTGRRRLVGKGSAEGGGRWDFERCVSVSRLIDQSVGQAVRSPFFSICLNLSSWDWPSNNGQFDYEKGEERK